MTRQTYLTCRHIVAGTRGVSVPTPVVLGHETVGFDLLDGQGGILHDEGHAQP